VYVVKRNYILSAFLFHFSQNASLYHFIKFRFVERQLNFFLHFINYQEVPTSSFSAVVVPYSSAASTMQSFLSFFGGLNIPKSEQDLSQEAFDARQALDFSKLVYELTENIIVDFPSFTPKISAILFRLVSRRQVGNFKFFLEKTISNAVLYPTPKF
jgi:hypothetical protein